MLETELQRVQQSSDIREKELREQIAELKNDNDRQQKLIGQVGNEEFFNCLGFLLICKQMW